MLWPGAVRAIVLPLFLSLPGTGGAMIFHHGPYPPKTPILMVPREFLTVPVVISPNAGSLAFRYNAR